ncbi:MAG: HlyD family efflux transporter periplasmic adaptor subunit [Lachnospiraceae bacterium]|nr:HlyD family efflux transporter periplasmic adaptor subunit [Lachnospiraceae bacterium]
MKPIIVDMKDMSDSTEVYGSKPNRFLVYTIYLILIILVVAILWMCFSKIDIVVKSNGIFKGSNAVYEISNGVTGTVKETHIENGQYVKEGDVLYVLSIEELSDTIMRYQNEFNDAEARLKILSAYAKSLDGDISELEAMADNPYYEELINRRKLLYANVSVNKNDAEGQVKLYQGNVDSLSGTIAKYKEKIEKLNAVKRCITVRDNTFDANESTYYSIVSSYLASYTYTASQYDNKINEYQKQIENYEEQIKKAEAEGSNDDILVNHGDLASDTPSDGTSQNSATIDVSTLEKQRDELITACDSVKKEKTQALMDLELQQITSVEQQIAAYNDTILSMETNLTSAKLQLDSANGIDNKAKEKVAVLTEKGNIAAEILTYEDKVKECETYLKSYDIQNDNCIIKANMSGFFSASQELKNGSFVQEGTTIGTIYPETESKYYAEIYVENSDIAKIKEGQEVKFEIAAYPSSEYGYFSGTVENIAKDISVDQSTGYAYYVVRVRCKDMTLKGKDGEAVSLINGMACQAKTVIDEKNVLRYLLEKIDLLD